MFEKVKDAFFLHEPGDEVEIGLAVLDAVLTLNEVSVQLELEVAETEVLKDLFNDVGSLLVLEDAAIGGSGEEPEPGNHHGVIFGQTGLEMSLRKAADEAIPIA